MTTDRIAEILADPSTSFWLKDVLSTALQRDAVDATNDAELLFEVLNERCNLILQFNQGQ